MIKQVKNRLASIFSTGDSGGSLSGYDATVSNNRRRAPSNKLTSEDRQLRSGARKRLVWSGRDLIRNYAVAAWAIRKHLDFVAEHTFHAKTDDVGLNNEIEAFVAEKSDPEEFDVAARHGVLSYNRIAEARNTVDGDFFTQRLRSGKVQAIEGDRIRSDVLNIPEVNGSQEMSQGIVYNKKTGKTNAYAVCKRQLGGFVFDRFISSRFIHQHAYFDRFDQYRGVSPLSSAMNSLRDTYESIDYAVARAKVAQLFGMTVYRDAVDSPGELTGPLVDTDGDGKEDEGYQVDFGKGPIFLDLNQGDRAEFLENKTPAPEFQSFIETLIGITLKSLDIPFSFYNESFTNFNGSRAALILYIKSTQAKRRGVQKFLYGWTNWRLQLAFGNGEIDLPRSIDPANIPFVWYPSGVPFWNPAQELGADITAIEAGLKTRAEVRLERNGDDWADVVQQLQGEEDLIRRSGITVTKAAPVGSAANPGPDTQGATNET